MQKDMLMGDAYSIFCKCFSGGGFWARGGSKGGGWPQGWGGQVLRRGGYVLRRGGQVKTRGGRDGTRGGLGHP